MHWFFRRLLLFYFYLSSMNCLFLIFLQKEIHQPNPELSWNYIRRRYINKVFDQFCAFFLLYRYFVCFSMFLSHISFSILDISPEILFKDSIKNDTCYQLLSDKEKQVFMNVFLISVSRIYFSISIFFIYFDLF